MILGNMPHQDATTTEEATTSTFHPLAARWPLPLPLCPLRLLHHQDLPALRQNQPQTLPLSWQPPSRLWSLFSSSSRCCSSGIVTAADSVVSQMHSLTQNTRPRPEENRLCALSQYLGTRHCGRIRSRSGVIKGVSHHKKTLQAACGRHPCRLRAVLPCGR